MPVSQPTAIPGQIKAPKTTAITSTENRSSVDDTKICWVELKQYPYQPDHQVELLHLQAEADALLLQLQNEGKQQP
ncbi:MAG: hypothetical protein AAFV85_00185 [Cyanobacteria bacterium J06634_6]